MLTLQVNSKSYQVDADPEMPLLWVLRDLLQKTGTKFGCGQGLCGACTILLDGQAIRSCVTPASSALGKKITTIEGLHPEGKHPLQVAWEEHNVPQCGFCQPGQIMNAAGLLQKLPAPTTAQIREHMAGNICRCGTYPRIEKAIQHVVQQSSKK